MTGEPTPRDSSSPLDRRDVLALGAASLAGLAAAGSVGAQDAPNRRGNFPPRSSARANPTIDRALVLRGDVGRSRHDRSRSYAFGIPSVELIDPEFWPLLK